MKKISKLVVSLVFFFLFIGFTKAGSLSISGTTSATVGSAVRVTVNIKNLAGRFRVTSSDSSVLAGGAEDFWESSQTVTFTAKKAGTATITVVPVDAADMDSGNAFSTSRSMRVTVKNSGSGNNNSGSNDNTIDINKKYSDNNFLASLSVEGYNLDPKFNKDTLQYKIELDSNIEKIKIDAKAEDDNASIKGLGEIQVAEGNNEIKITVVAENGNEKVYIINAVVEDKNPIIVKIGKKKYTVVKNLKLLKMPTNYKETTVKINDAEIPAFSSDITGYLLVGLKDSKGNINLFVYNSSNGKYFKYQETSFDGVRIQYLKPSSKKIINGFKKYIEKINNEKVNIYKKNKKDNFSLIYGMNVDTGDISWYSYDKKENTLQRYNYKELRKYEETNNKYLIVLSVLSISLLMLILFIMILMIKIRNVKRN